jgi:branched-chain amino acid transport system permease protein
MDLRAQWMSWQRQVAEGARRALQLAKLAWEAACRLAHAARNRVASLAGRLLPAARHLTQGTTRTLAAMRARMVARTAARTAEWRRGASPTASAALARGREWGRQGATRTAAATNAVRSGAAGLAARVRDMRGRLARTPLVQRAGTERARAAAWLRTGPLAPATARVDRWLTARRSPAEGRYRIEVATPLSRYVAAGGAALLVLLIALPAFAGRNLINDLIFVFTMLALAQYWNLLAGYAGLVSVGQQAFVGLGGYLLFARTIHAGIDPLAAIVLAGLIAAGLALLTALVVFRLRGAYFAIGTWVMAEVYRLVFAQFRQLGGGTGTSLPPSVTNEVAGLAWVRALFDVRTPAARDIVTYWAALALAAGTILLVYLILRSRHGLALAAIRDSERAAESVGVDNFKTKLRLYVVTAAGTGMVGALIYLQKARISPDAAFSVLDWTAYVIFIVVIGGIGTIEGPIVGVLVFYFLQTNLAHFGTWYLILLGVFAIVIMLFAPKGIWGFLADRYGLAVFPIRRRLVANGADATPGPVEPSKPST